MQSIINSQKKQEKQKNYHALVNPTTNKQQLVLKATRLDTKLGTMVAIADDAALFLLEFVDGRGVENERKRLQKKLSAVIIPGETNITDSIAAELQDYFSGKCLNFKTPIHLLGSPFQKNVWQQLRQIPCGETRSYLEIAKAVHKPTAYRAVAQANGANQLSIIIPCHRVINHNGNLGGYAGGIERKSWLLKHENQFANDAA